MVDLKENLKLAFAIRYEKNAFRNLNGAKWSIEDVFWDAFKWNETCCVKNEIYLDKWERRINEEFH